MAGYKPILFKAQLWKLLQLVWLQTATSYTLAPLDFQKRQKATQIQENPAGYLHICSKTAVNDYI